MNIYKKILIFLFLFFFCFNSYAVKKIGKVVIYGGIFEYKLEEEKVYVRDKAHIFYDEIEIFADNIQIDIKEDKVLASGNVIFWQGDSKTEGDYLEYSNKTGDGYVENAILTRDQTIMYADKIYMSVRKITGENIIWTSCELDKPHYYMKASNIEIFPDVVMYAYNMRFVIHGDTIIKQKLYKVDIRPLKENFKYKYGYSKNKGVWFNIRFNYILNKVASCWLTYNHVSKGAKNFSTTNSFKLNGGKDSLNFNTSATISEDGNSDSSNYTLNYSGRLKTGSFNLSTNFISREYLNTAENTELNYNLTLNTTLGKNIFKLKNMTVNWKERKDPDGTSYPADDNIRVFDKIPEIRVTSDRFSLLGKNLNFNYDVLYGKYFEGGASKIYATKREEKFNISTKSYDFNDFGRFNLSSNISHASDSSGNDQKTYMSNASLTQKFGRKFTINNNWSRRDQWGTSAFSVNTTAKTLNYRNTMSYVDGDFKLTLLSYSYDLENNNFSSGMYSDMRYKDNKFEYYLKYSMTPDSNSLGGFYKGFDFDVTDVYNRLSYNFNTKEYLRLTFPYDRTTHKFSSLYSELNFAFNNMYLGKMFLELDRINFKVNWRKDLVTSKTTALNMTATLDLHCWEALIKWDRNTKEGWLEFYIKAFSNNKHKIFYDAETGQIKPILKKIETD